MNDLYPTLEEHQRQKVDAMLSVLFRHHRRLTHPFIMKLFLLKREEYARQIQEGSL
ncbi:MAG TPA: hypothetical protein VLM37_09790 [Fibrobacteraceae bacterium]|nr:hypothetical protein [Fibrobacteraceae bacterium]